ncbi:MAG: nickel-type superoxide dismutase maturation protease [Anaerolineae bacterium]|nr:nickel-type superoxide dismutase maturation protease [Anaerolineae bacterium]
MNKNLKTGGLREFVLWLVRRRQRFRVSGNSMQPLLQPGEEVLINPAAYLYTAPQPGDIVVVIHPYQPGLRMIKRLTAIGDGHRYFVEGDNPAESTDSRSFGPVGLEHIVGQVTSRF